MYIPNNDTQNQPLNRLQLALGTLKTLNLMNQPIKFQEKSRKLLRQRVRRGYFKTLGTSVNCNKQPNHPILPVGTSTKVASTRDK